MEIKRDPWEELTPNNIILDHIQPDSLGQCVLRELNVLIVLKGLDLYSKIILLVTNVGNKCAI